MLALHDIVKDYWDKLDNQNKEEFVEYTLKLITEGSKLILPFRHFTVRYALLYI